jgi:hypothetical protein
LRVTKKRLPSVATAFIQVGQMLNRPEDLHKPFSNPKLVYNSTGEFVFGLEYDTKELDAIRHRDEIRWARGVCMSFYVSSILVTVIVVAHMSLFFRFGEAKDESQQNVEVKTVILNPYCKESSTQIVVAGVRHVGNRPLLS